MPPESLSSGRREVQRGRGWPGGCASRCVVAVFAAVAGRVFRAGSGTRKASAAEQSNLYRRGGDLADDPPAAVGPGTLETAVLELLRTLPPEFWPQPCKRLQVRAEDQKTRLSGNTGSYNQARQELPLTIVEQCGDRTFLKLIEQTGRPAAASRRDAFFVDGSSLRMPDSAALRAAVSAGIQSVRGIALAVAADRGCP